MKIKILILFLFTFFTTACSQETINQVEETQDLQKTSQGQYPYLQEFHNLPCTWISLQNDSLFIKINNENLFNITKEYFAIIQYSYETVTIYLKKPYSSTFFIPYYGSNEIVDVKIYGIIVPVTKIY